MYLPYSGVLLTSPSWGDGPFIVFIFILFGLRNLLSYHSLTLRWHALNSWWALSAGSFMGRSHFSCVSQYTGRAHPSVSCSRLKLLGSILALGSWLKWLRLWWACCLEASSASFLSSLTAVTQVPGGGDLTLGGYGWGEPPPMYTCFVVVVVYSLKCWVCLFWQQAEGSELIFSFHYGLSQDIEHCSLCSAVGPCCLSTLYLLVCIC